MNRECESKSPRRKTALSSGVPIAVAAGRLAERAARGKTKRGGARSRGTPLSWARGSGPAVTLAPSSAPLPPFICVRSPRVTRRAHI